MGTPPLARSLAEDAVTRVEVELRAGHRPPGLSGQGYGAVRVAAQKAVAEKVCGAVPTFYNRIGTAKELYGLEPDWGLYRAQRYQQPVPRSVLSPAPQDNAPEPGEGERVLVIGDLHQDPRHPDRLEVLKWLARYASEERFGRIIQIGDWSTNDSVSKYDRNDTYKARYKPQIRDDLDNLKASLGVFQRNKAEDYRPRMVELLGNHDSRLEIFENNTPEAHGTFTLERDQAFLQHGWKTRAYGELYYCQGVAFAHHPTNGIGRAFGGETGPARAANKTTVAMVSGHTHRAQRFDAAKIGPVETVSMVEVGCAMPWGTIESYVGAAPAGWWWGACAMTVSDGLIVDLEFKSMKAIRSRYSDDGSDVQAA